MNTHGFMLIDIQYQSPALFNNIDDARTAGDAMAEAIGKPWVGVVTYVDKSEEVKKR